MSFFSHIFLRVFAPKYTKAEEIELVTISSNYVLEYNYTAVSKPNCVLECEYTTVSKSISIVVPVHVELNTVADPEQSEDQKDQIFVLSKTQLIAPHELIEYSFDCGVPIVVKPIYTLLSNISFFNLSSVSNIFFFSSPYYLGKSCDKPYDPGIDL